MRKPFALKIVLVIAWLQIAQSIFAFLAATSCIVAPASGGFWLGFQNAAARGLSSANGVRSFGPEQFGEAIAYVIIAAVFPIGVLSCIKKRSKGGMVAFIVVGMVVAIGQRAIPLLSLIALIAAFHSSITDFFLAPLKPNEQPEPRPFRGST